LIVNLTLSVSFISEFFLIKSLKSDNNYTTKSRKLGCLIDRKNRKVEVYRLGFDFEKLDNPNSLSGENVLPGFVLDLAEVW